MKPVSGKRIGKALERFQRMFFQAQASMPWNREK